MKPNPLRPIVGNIIPKQEKFETNVKTVLFTNLKPVNAMNSVTFLNR